MAQNRQSNTHPSKVKDAQPNPSRCSNTGKWVASKMSKGKNSEALTTLVNHMACVTHSGCISKTRLMWSNASAMKIRVELLFFILPTSPSDKPATKYCLNYNAQFLPNGGFGHRHNCLMRRNELDQ